MVESWLFSMISCVLSAASSSLDVDSRNCWLDFLTALRTRPRTVLGLGSLFTGATGSSFSDGLSDERKSSLSKLNVEFKATSILLFFREGKEVGGDSSSLFSLWLFFPLFLPLLGLLFSSGSGASSADLSVPSSESQLSSTRLWINFALKWMKR